MRRLGAEKACRRRRSARERHARISKRGLEKAGTDAVRFVYPQQGEPPGTEKLSQTKMKREGRNRGSMYVSVCLCLCEWRSSSYRKFTIHTRFVAKGVIELAHDYCVERDD